MTRVNFFGALAVVAVTIAAIAVLPRSQGNTGTSKAKIEAVGLSKYGLDIIDPKHPAFSKLMAARNPGPVSAFSVFVVNNGDQAITSCSLKWEIISPDGQVNTHYQTKGDTLETVVDGGIAHLNEGIATKGNLLFSLMESSGPDNPSRIGTGSTMRGGSSNVAAQLSNSVKITVSIDGVLFTDGTYVGPDTNNYFELFRGQVEANRDLAVEIDRLLNDGATPQAITHHLNKVANTQSSEVQIPSGEDPQYSFGKWMQRRGYAMTLLLIREKKGDQAFLDRVRTELSTPQIKMRKLKEN